MTNGKQLAVRGRPRGERQTVPVRLYREQAEKLGWLFKIRGVRAGDFIFQRIAADLDAEFAKIAPVVKQIKRSASKPATATN